MVDLAEFFDFSKIADPLLAKRDVFNVLYLGRRHPLKGMEYLEEAVKRIKESGKKIELRMVSDATGEEKERIWEWCDILVLPTLSENFGLVVAEALERGKLAITTDGAPVWATFEDRHGKPGKLTYLRGFCAGNEEMRVKMLQNALLKSYSACL
jgi:glycosyltransferase involved in cell wall biosynthesis